MNNITRSIIGLFLVFFFFGCAARNYALLDVNTFKLVEYSNDSTYGYSPKNPIRVGGVDNGQGPLNERRFLNALMGPNGEEISYERIGSRSGEGKLYRMEILDMYSVTYDGLAEPAVLYISMYVANKLKVPVGFKIKE